MLRARSAKSKERRGNSGERRNSENFGRNLKEKCWLEHYLQCSFEYIVKSYLVPKLLSKESQTQTTNSQLMLTEQPDNFDEILQAKSRFEKYLKEKC